MSHRKLQWLVKRLQEATKSAIAQSEEVARVVEDATVCGYQFAVVLDIVIQDAGPEGQSETLISPTLQLNVDDLQFLKSLRITLSPGPH
jgi:hypothetical protein